MQHFDQLRQRFHSYLQSVSFNKEPRALYRPVKYIMNLGGKHVRPVLLLMAHNLFDDRLDKALPPALAIEMFHNFSLLHDDIMDQAQVRRGKPAAHIQFGTNTAILAGDVMLIYVYDFLTRSVPPPNLSNVLAIFNRMAIEVCEGQQMDMDFESFPSVSIDEYLEMITLKTAVLIGSALQIGAILGGATSEDARQLYLFGKNMGIAFQIQDDLLDAFGDPALFGKKIGGDIVQNKKTYLYLKARQNANPDQLQLLHTYYTQENSDESAKIKAVTQLFLQLGVDRSAEQLKDKYQQTALQHLEKVQCPASQKQPLLELADELLARKL